MHHKIISKVFQAGSLSLKTTCIKRPYFPFALISGPLIQVQLYQKSRGKLPFAKMIVERYSDLKSCLGMILAAKVPFKIG